MTRSSGEKAIFATLCQSHFSGVLEAESRWQLVAKCMAGEDGEEGNEYITFIIFKQLG